MGNEKNVGKLYELLYRDGTVVVTIISLFLTFHYFSLYNKIYFSWLWKNYTTIQQKRSLKTGSLKNINDLNQDFKPKRNFD